MLVMKADNPRQFVRQVQEHYPEKKITQIVKLRPGMYALVENKIDKKVIREVTNWKDRDSKRNYH